MRSELHTPGPWLLLCAALWLTPACNSGAQSQTASSTPAKELAVSSSDKPSGPPGPPPGPPGPPPPPGAIEQDVSRYKQYLDRIGAEAPDSDLHEEERLRAGPWRFYYRGPATARTHQVALDDGGRAVALKSGEHWNALLSDPALDAAGAHERIAWLMGHAAPVGPGYKFKDPAVAERVTAPALDRSDSGDVVFTGWVVYPPQMQVPYRVVVRAPKTGEATLETTEWSKVSQ